MPLIVYAADADERLLIPTDKLFAFKMPNTRIVKIGFEEYIAPRDLSRFRGVMIRLSGDNELFHNHQGVTGYHYSYPRYSIRL